MVSAPVLVDKVRLELGEATERTDLRTYSERVARELGLDPADVLAEAERILGLERRDRR